MQLRAVKGLCSSVAWVHFSRVACALLVQLRKKTYQKIDWSEEAQWFLVDLWCQIPSLSITPDSTLNVYGCMLFSCSFQIHGTSENLDADWRSDHGAVLLGCLRFQELAASPPDACFRAGLQGTLPGRATWSKWLAADLKLWKAGQFVTPAQHELTLVCPNRTGTESNAYRNTPFAQKNGAKGGVQLAILATKPLLSWKPWWPVRQRLTSSPSFRPSTAGWPLHSPWRPSLKEFQIAAGRASKAPGGAATLAPLHSYTWGVWTRPQVIGDQAPYTAGPGTPSGAFRPLRGEGWRSCCT